MKSGSHKLTQTNIFSPFSFCGGLYIPHCFCLPMSDASTHVGPLVSFFLLGWALMRVQPAAVPGVLNRPSGRGRALRP